MNKHAVSWWAFLGTWKGGLVFISWFGQLPSVGYAPEIRPNNVCRAFHCHPVLEVYSLKAGPPAYKLVHKVTKV